jgi:hypothetical protein
MLDVPADEVRSLTLPLFELQAELEEVRNLRF